MITFIIYIALSFLAGRIASYKGRSFVGFFLISLCLTPIVGLLAAAIARTADEKQDFYSGLFGLSGTKKCPDCGEQIKPEAKVCRFCGLILPQ